MKILKFRHFSTLESDTAIEGAKRTSVAIWSITSTKYSFIASHLSQFESESISGQLADSLDGANKVARAGGDELNLGVLCEGGKVLEDESLPDASKLQQRHDI